MSKLYPCYVFFLFSSFFRFAIATEKTYSWVLASHRSRSAWLYCTAVRWSVTHDYHGSNRCLSPIAAVSDSDQEGRLLSACCNLALPSPTTPLRALMSSVLSSTTTKTMTKITKTFWIIVDETKTKTKIKTTDVNEIEMNGILVLTTLTRIISETMLGT